MIFHQYMHFSFFTTKLDYIIDYPYFDMTTFHWQV